MKADSGFQDNYSVVVASGTWSCFVHTSSPVISQLTSTGQPHSVDFINKKYLWTLMLSLSYQV